MRNLTEYVTNKLLNDIVDETVREALRLQQKAEKVREEQRGLELKGGSYNYRDAVLLEEGVHALCDVLWRIFGDLPIFSIQAIQKIALENINNTLLGHDSQDYVAMFMDAFEERRK